MNWKRLPADGAVPARMLASNEKPAKSSGSVAPVPVPTVTDAVAAGSMAALAAAVPAASNAAASANGRRWRLRMGESSGVGAALSSDVYRRRRSMSTFISVNHRGRRAERTPRHRATTWDVPGFRQLDWAFTASVNADVAGSEARTQKRGLGRCGAGRAGERARLSPQRRGSSGLGVAAPRGPGPG